MSRLTFTRKNGLFDFSEQGLASIVASLRESSGSLARLPESLVDAASRQLAKESRVLMGSDKLSFDAAAARVIVDRPNLAFLSRCEKVRDSDYSADASITEAA